MARRWPASVLFLIVQVIELKHVAHNGTQTAIIDDKFAATSRNPRMEPPAQAARMCFGPFEADLRSGELRKHGVRLKLQEQPFQVLVLLLEHAGEVVTREELRQRLWPAETFVDFDTGLNRAVKRLRDVLADSADQPRYIETFPRRGYRSTAQVTNIGQPTAAPFTEGL